jgi:hypothetical protein
VARPESFFAAVDAAWEPPVPGKTTLRIIKNFHTVQRDFLAVPETEFDL